MAEPRCFQTQLNSIMEIMSRAVVRQICKIVDSDLASLRLELERALHDNAALGDKMRVLESEVETMRKAGARARRKSCRSVCIQTSEGNSFSFFVDTQSSFDLVHPSYRSGQVSSGVLTNRPNFPDVSRDQGFLRLRISLCLSNSTTRGIISEKSVTKQTAQGLGLISF